MEGFIIAIVIALIGRMFAGGNKEQEQTKDAMPPFGNQSKPAQTEVIPDPPKRPSFERKTFTSLEDFTKEIFGQLNEKAEQTSAENTVKDEAVQRVFEPETSTVNTRANLERTSDRKSTRPEFAASRPIVQKEMTKAKDYIQIPSTQQQLVQAIIASEIIGEPKARQTRRIQ